VQTRQALPLLDAPLTVACRCRDQDVTQEFPPPTVAREHQLEQKLLEPKMQPQGVQPVSQDESESPRVRLWQARSEQVSPQEPSSQEPLRLQEEPQPQVSPGTERPAQPASPPRALPFRLQPPAPQVSQASVAQPRVL
jgi:hypothetical protein